MYNVKFYDIYEEEDINLTFDTHKKFFEKIEIFIRLYNKGFFRDFKIFKNNKDITKKYIK